MAYAILIFAHTGLTILLSLIVVLLYNRFITLKMVKGHLGTVDCTGKEFSTTWKVTFYNMAN